MAKKYQTGRHKLTRLVMVLGVFYVVASVGVALLATGSWRFASSNMPRDFSDVSISTTDGVELRGRAFVTHHRPLVVLAHDYHSACGSFSEFAHHLTQEGYDVLAFDFRGHGDSGKSMVSGGPFEVEDVRAIFRWIEDERPDGLANVAWVGIGAGAAALTFCPEAEELDCAVLVDCYEDLEHAWGQRFEAATQVGLRPLGSLMTLVAEWRLGRPLHSVRPADGLRRLTRLPILIIQSQGDLCRGRNVGEGLWEAAGPGAALYLHEGTPRELHGLATDVPARRELMEFLDHHL